MALDTHDRRCDLLFLFSILSVGCSDDGVPATSDQGSTSGPAGSTSGDATLATSASTSATSSAPTSGEATSTDTDGSGANTDGSGGSSSNDSSGSSSDVTSEGTTIATDGTMGTTEETMGSTASSSSGGEPTLCELSGAFYADCFGGGDPEVEEMAIAYCEEAIAAYFDISDECGMLQETLFLCITTLECIEVGMVGNGGECDDAYDAAMAACM